MHPPLDVHYTGKPGSDSAAMRFFQEMDYIRKVWQNFKPDGGLSKNTLGMLALLHREEGGGRTQMSVSDLARKMGQSTPAVSQKVSTLVQQGYLERTGNPADRRVCYVKLTDSGRQFAQKAFESFMGRVEEALSELGPEQTETLLRLMHNLAEVMDSQTQGQSEQMEESTP